VGGQRDQHQDGQRDPGDRAGPDACRAEKQAKPDGGARRKSGDGRADAARGRRPGLGGRELRAGLDRVGQRGRAGAEHGEFSRAVEQVHRGGRELAAERRHVALGPAGDTGRQQRRGYRRDGQGCGQHQARAREQERRDGDGGCAGQRGDCIRQPDSQPAVGERVDVTDQAADQVAGAKGDRTGGREAFQSIVGGHPEPAEDAQGRVMAGQPLGVPEDAAADAERLDRGHRHHEVQHRRVLGGSGDQPGRRGQQPDRRDGRQGAGRAR
jgi:hypothetical protein